jgi:hypothetical protein
MDQESKKWTRGNKYCIQNIKTVNIAFDLDPHKYNTLHPSAVQENGSKHSPECQWALEKAKYSV